ncbi:MAG: HAD family hydrolase, partial [Candidatus Andersenbacteria bacterium]
RLVVEARFVGREATWSVLAATIERLATALPPALRKVERAFLWVQLGWIIFALLALVLLGGTGAERSSLVWLVLAGAWWLGPLLARGALAATTVRELRRGLVPTSWSIAERSRRLSLAVLDKTGTLTAGTPTLVDVRTIDDRLNRDDVLRLAAALERPIDHPIARALRRAATEARLTPPGATDVRLVASRGVTGNVAGERFALGTVQHVADLAPTVPEQLAQFVERQEQQGATVLLLAGQGEVLAALSLSDVPRPTAATLVQRLSARKIETHVVSGDTQHAVHALSDAVGVTREHAQPRLGASGKEAHVREHHDRRVLFVGDPVADRGALAQATLGVAFRGRGPALTDPAMQALVRSDDLTLVDELLTYAARLRVLPLLAMLGDIVIVAALTAAVLVTRG